MRHHHPALMLPLAAALLLSACSTTPAPSNTQGAAPAPASSSLPSKPSLTIPVAEPFGEAAWGVQVAPTWSTAKPLVTAERAVALDGATLLAFDAQGKQAWSLPWSPFAEDSRTSGTQPVLRLASPEVVAVVDLGKSEGEGLAKASYVAKVWLVRIADGSLVKEVTVPGIQSDGPDLGKIGLGFTAPGGKAVAVTPEGEVVDAPAPPSDAKVKGAATVGEHVLSLWQNKGSGFSATGWTSQEATPSASFTQAAPWGSDADTLLIGRWNDPFATGAVYRLLDAASGKEITDLDCGPSVEASLVTSPSRGWKVTGGLRLSPENKAECVGGGSGQKIVTFTAVTDVGRAFGMATAGGSESLFVDSTPGQEPKTSPLPDRVNPPLGVMNGNLAVHWDDRTGIITANPFS